MQKDKNYLLLNKFSVGLGANLFGIADISRIKKEFILAETLINKFDRAICLGLRLSQAVLEEIGNSPTKLYFHHYRTVNASLDQMALRLVNFIQAKGFLALAIPASQIIDWENQKGHLSHKKIGYLAGLGWLGRNNLLVNEKLGAQFRLACILTDMPLKKDLPLKKDCGKCRLCVSTCPAEAIKDEPDKFEHTKCFEQLKEFQRQKLVDQYICGVCVKACCPKK